MNKQKMISRETGDRIFGLARATFYGALTYAVLKDVSIDYQHLNYWARAIPFAITGTFLAVDGLADLASGELFHIQRSIIRNIHKRIRENAN